MNDILRANDKELCAKAPSLNREKLTRLRSAFSLASLAVKERISLPQSINRGLDYIDMFYHEFLGETRERVVVVYLNGALQVQEIYNHSHGTDTEAIVDPRHIFKRAIEHESSSFILAHNHPSGRTDPSKEDIELTKELLKVGEYVDIKLVDHMIFGARTRKNPIGHSSVFDKIGEPRFCF